MKNFRRILLASTLTIAATGLASATTITGQLTATQSQSGGPTTFNFGNGAPQPNVPLVFNQFNAASIEGSLTPDAGFTIDAGSVTLTSIHFTYSTSVAGSYSVTNGSGSTASYTVTDSAIVDLTSFGGGAYYEEALPTNSITIHNLADGATATGTLTATGTGSADYNGSGSLTGHTGGNPDASISVTPFLGSGTVTLYAVGNFTGSIGGTSFTGSVGGTGSETATLAYDYSFSETAIPSSTPEPATFALFGGALLGAGLLRKRVVR